MAGRDFDKETELLRDNLEQAEQERDKLKDICKSLEKQKSELLEGASARHHA